MELNAQIEEFVGREWVFGEVNRWLAVDGLNALLIIGNAGSGKSAFTMRLLEIGRNDETGIYPTLRNLPTFSHFCRASDDSTLTPLRFIEALSLTLAKRYPDFAEELSQAGDGSIHIDVKQTVRSIPDGGQVTAVKIESLHIGDISSRLAFDRVVRKPLDTLLAKGLMDQITIVVDALDEGFTIHPTENIPVLLSHFLTANLSPKVRLLLTSRKDQKILNLIKGKLLDLENDDPDINHDVATYAAGRLVNVEQLNRDKLAQTIAEHSKGNFLYARYLLDYLLSDATRLAQISQSRNLEELDLPTGLVDVYRQFMQREVGSQLQLWQRSYRPVLGALAVAKGNGLDRKQLGGVTGLPEAEVGDALGGCSQFLKGFPNGPFAIYHESFREFLIAEQTYQVYPRAANEMIVEYFLGENQNAWLTCNDDYALRNVPRHLIEIADLAVTVKERRRLTGTLIDILTDFEFLETKTARIGVDDLLLDLRMTKDLKNIPADSPLREVLKVVNAEAVNLRGWTSQQSKGLETPAFFAQQILNRATELKTTALLESAKARLRVLKLPHLLVRWQSRRPGAGNVFKAFTFLRRMTGLGSTPKETIQAVAITRDGKLAIGGSKDGSLSLWDLESQQYSSLFAQNPKPVVMVKTSDDGKHLFAALEDSTFQVWNLESRKKVRWLTLNQPLTANSITVTADGGMGVLIERQNDLTKLDLQTEQRVATFTGNPTNGKLSALNMTNDGRRLVVGTSNGNIILLDADTGNQIGQLGIPSKASLWDVWKNLRSVFAVAVSPNGSLAISASLEKMSGSTIRLWDITSGRVVASVKLDGTVGCLAFADDSTTIVAGDETGGLYALRYVAP
jgi:outer membrane protein assembly factor BamB